MRQSLGVKIIVNRRDLLTQILKHRERYQESLDALLVVYKQKVEEFQKAYLAYTQKVIDKIVTENDKEPYAPREPEDRTKDYDYYIEMLEFHRSETVQLTEPAYNALWCDKWDWMSTHIRALEFWANDSDEVAASFAAYTG